MSAVPLPEEDRSAVADAQSFDAPERSWFEPRRRMIRSRPADRWSSFE